MFDTITQFELLTLTGGLVGMWIKHSNDHTRLKSRVYVLEQEQNSVMADMATILAELHDIKLLLARNQMQ